MAANNKVIFQTHTHELWVTGQGFTRQTFTTNVVFDPPLSHSGDDPDVSLVVYNRTHMKLTLLSGKKWVASVNGGSSVNLKVRQISTGESKKENGKSLCSPRTSR